MTLADAIRMSASNLRGRLMRTLLTILGLGVGVAAVLTVITLGSAGELRVEQEIVKLGVNKIWVRPAGDEKGISLSSAEQLRRETGAPVCAGAYTAAVLNDQGCTRTVQVAGYDIGCNEVHKIQIVAGRLLHPVDHERAHAVCVVDEGLAEQLGGNPLGRYISLGARSFLVVGVVKRMPAQMMSGINGFVILPMSAFMDTFAGNVAELTISVPMHLRPQMLAEQIEQHLSEDETYRIDTLEKEINAAREIVRIFVMVLLCVACVCVLTGGIGVMNVLMICVRERRREIGLMKALGASASDIASIFLLEALIYAVLGGMLGLVLGYLMIVVFGYWIGLEAVFTAAVWVPVLLGSSLLGVMFGVLPSLKAASLEPVIALGSE